MDWPIERKVQWGLGIAVAGLCAVAMIAYALILSFVNTSNWVLHTHLVIETIQGVRTALDDAETSVRGYLLTQDPHYLEPYNLVLGRIPGVVDRLVILTSDNPDERQRMALLKSQVDREMALLGQGIEAGGAHPASPALEREWLDLEQQSIYKVVGFVKGHMHP